MSNVNSTVEQTVQNVPVPATENAEVKMEFVELPVPNFKITTITKRMARLINTGNYQNTTIETAITAEVEENNIQQVASILEEMIIADLNKQETEIRDKVVAEEEEKKQQEIKQSEAMAARMKKINVYKWLVSNHNGDQITVSNDLHYQMTCPRCGGKLEKRKGRNGDFYGCSNYTTTKCGCTLNVEALTDWLNRAVEFLSTNQVPHPEKIYGYATSPNYIELDTTLAMQEEQPNLIQQAQGQQPQPVQQVHHGQVLQYNQAYQQYRNNYINQQQSNGYIGEEIPF